MKSKIHEFLTKKIIMNKNLFTIFVLLFMYHLAAAQNLLTNGSLELNNATVNSLNLTINWADTVLDSWPIDAGSMDLITTNSCNDASEGNWFVTTSPQSGLWPYLSFSLKFSPPLVSGVPYKLSFDKTYCGPNTSPVDIGLSNDSTLIGTALHTFAAPLVSSWEADSFLFTASNDLKYLTINVGTTGTTGVIGLDNFIVTTNYPVSINEHFASTDFIFQNPVSDFLTIQLNSHPKNFTIEIYEVTGRQVKSVVFKNSGGGQVDVSNFTEGIYFFRVNGSCFKKFVVNR